jgi:predicted N-formylglutamate amidohydrolase
MRPIGGAGVGRGRPEKLRILADDEPADCEVLNPDGASKFLLLCDHASKDVPRSLHNLGLSDEQLSDHIGWDPGAGELTRRLSKALDATAVLSRWSRLVIDCNRSPKSSQSILAKSDGVRVVGNETVNEERAIARADAAFWPYHNQIAEILDVRQADRRPTVLVSIHSFTPMMAGNKRPWEIGFLYGNDDSLAQYLMQWLKGERPDLNIGDNQPYQVRKGTDYSIPVHGEERGLYSVLIEMRNDEIKDDIGIDFWSAILASGLKAVEPKLRFLDPLAKR